MRAAKATRLLKGAPAEVLEGRMMAAPPPPDEARLVKLAVRTFDPEREYTGPVMKTFLDPELEPNIRACDRDAWEAWREKVAESVHHPNGSSEVKSTHCARCHGFVDANAVPETPTISRYNTPVDHCVFHSGVIMPCTRGFRLRGAKPDDVWNCCGRDPVSKGCTKAHYCDTTLRKCVRCGEFSDTENTCAFHPGTLSHLNMNENSRPIWHCCHADRYGAPGCAESDSHVFVPVRLAPASLYVPPTPPATKAPQPVVASQKPAAVEIPAVDHAPSLSVAHTPVRASPLQDRHAAEKKTPQDLFSDANFLPEGYLNRVAALAEAKQTAASDNADPDNLPQRSPTHKLPPSPTHKLPPSPTHKLPPSPTHKLPPSPTHKPPPSPTPKPLVRSPTHKPQTSPTPKASTHSPGHSPGAREHGFGRDLHPTKPRTRTSPVATAASPGPKHIPPHHPPLPAANSRATKTTHSPTPTPILSSGLGRHQAR